jgi:hypothetical protein
MGKDVYIPAVTEPTQPASSGSAVPAPSSAPVAKETVSRPDPGLAQGVWEAKPVAFYAAGGVVVAAAVIYAAVRAGLFRKRSAPKGRGT